MRICSFALVLTAACALGRAWAQPLVPNAGVEQGAGKSPANWTWRTGEGSQGEFTWEAALAHSGRRSVRIKKPGAGGYTSLVSDFVAVEPGTTYRVSAWIYPIRRARRGVYFMITQHKPGDASDQLPNTFGRTSVPFVRKTWQELEVNVTIREGNTRLRVHCIQAFAASEVCYDDFAIAEAGQEPPARYVPPVPEEVPALGPARAIVAERPRARAEVQVRAGRPRLIVDGESIPWAFHVTWDGKDLEQAHIRDFAKAGARVHLVPLVLGNAAYGRRGPWLGKGRYDFSVVDDMLWRVLRSNPHGYVIFYMACDPYFAWGAENPDHVTCDQNGLKAIVHMHPKRWGGEPVGPGERFGPSLVSHKLRADVAETLGRLVAHVEKSEPGKAVIGYHVAGLNDGQWFQWARLRPDDLHLADYCPGAQASFREWLTRRYGRDVDALRKAWGRPALTFEAAQIPAGERWWNQAVFLDPRTQTDLADYTRFYSEGVAETVMGLAGLLKQATPRPIICGTYYEDISCNSMNHVALGRYLNSPELDYFAGPAAYGIRMAGYQGAVRSIFGSTLLHGKTYLTEQDWRSWLSHPSTSARDFSVGRAATSQQHNAMVRRECGMMLAFGLGTWWYDMGGGWFADPDIMAGIAEALAAFGRELAFGGCPRGDLAVFVSEQSDSWISPRHGGTYRYGGITTQIQELNLAGVPYRLYLLSDLGRVQLPEHRAYVFLNPYWLTDTHKRSIARLKRDGKLLAFVHAPGLVGSDDPAATITAITGINVRALGPTTRLQQNGADSGHPLLEGLEGEIALSTGVSGPAFGVVDAAATTLGRFHGSESIASAARDFGAWKCVLFGCPGISAGFAHNLAKWAGCWVAADAGDAVYANERFATIHALFPGHKRLSLARPSRVTDLATGQIVADRADAIEVDMARGETRWFVLQGRP